MLRRLFADKSVAGIAPGAALCTLGSMEAIAWWARSPVLLRLFEDSVKLDRATLIFLAGAYCFFAGMRKGKVAAAFATALLFIALARLVEHGFVAVPGSRFISPLAALGFVICGFGMLASLSQQRRWQAATSATSAIVLLGASFFFTAFLIDPDLLAPAEALKRISPQVAVALLLSSFSVFARVLPEWHQKGHYPPRLLLFAGLGGVAGIAATLWLAAIWAQYLVSERRVEQALSTAVNFIDAYVEHSLTSAVLLISRVEQALLRDTTASAAAQTSRDWQQLVAAQHALPYVENVYVLDRQGGVLLSGRYLSAQPNFAERAFFLAHRDAGVKQVIGPSERSLLTGRPVFTISRRIGEGDSQRIVAVTILASHYDAVLSRAGLTQTELAGIANNDGAVLALSGGRSPLKLNLRALYGLAEGDLRQRDLVNIDASFNRDVASLLAVSGSSQLGIRAFASLPRDALLSEWRRTVGSTATILIIVLSGLSVLGVLGLHSIEREESLQRQTKSMAAFRAAVLDSASVAIYATDASGTLSFLNSAAEKLLGYSAKELVGHARPLIFLEPDEVTARAEEIGRLRGGPLRDRFDAIVGRLSMQTADEREWAYVRKDGSRVPVIQTVSALRDSQGNAVGFMAVAQDISARRKAERELRFSEARLRAVVDNIVDGILTLNAKGIIQSANPAAERMFACAAQSMIGQPFSKLVASAGDGHGDDYLDRMMHKAYEHGAHEFEGVRADRTNFPMELALSRVEFVGREMFVAVARDLSERRKIERLKAEFVSTVSHELRTPLTAIRGSLGLVNSGVLGELSDEIKELTLVAEESTERLVRLINDILDVEKISAGELKLELSEFDSRAVVQRAIASLEPFATAYSVHLRAEYEADGSLRADPDRLVQILINLISNAIKFSPADADVVVRTRTPKPYWLRIEVRDDGPGVPEEFRSQLFERFAQADASDAKEKGGTGLGLSIAKGLTERMGGLIGFASNESGGACFYVDFPLQTAAADMRRDRAAERSRVLHVEDDDNMRTIVGRLLADNADVVGARSVDEALTRCAAQDFDVAIIDVGLPDGNGFDVIPHLENRAGHRPPVVAFSAYDELPLPVPVEVAAVFVKSRSSERELVARVRELLAQAEAESELR